jgi:hypothetical protein
MYPLLLELNIFKNHSDSAMSITFGSAENMEV